MMVEGFVLDQMVTNFSVLNFLEILLVNGILDLLIKSQAFFVHRRTQQFTAEKINWGLLGPENGKVSSASP